MTSRQDQPPQVVFVDWHNTLSTSRFWAHDRRSRLPPDVLDNVESYVFSQDELVTTWMLGHLSAEEVCALAAEDLGLRPEEVLADLEQSCRGMKLHDPSVVTVLRSLSRRGIKVVLATDNMDTFARWTVPALRLATVFDEILCSASCGWLKASLHDGHSMFFEPWLTDHGIRPGRGVLVDDHPAEAVEAIGMGQRQVRHPGDLARVLAEI